MDYIDVAVVISLGLTVPTLFGCFAVLYLWWAPAGLTWRDKHKTETQYFIIGVVIGFAGNFIDNLYWSFPWLADYFNLPYKDALFDHGALFNVVFRQIATAVAAGFHVSAAVETDSKIFRYSILGGWLLGILAVGLLFWAGPE